MSCSDNTPIIVGVSQSTWRDQDPSRTPTDALQEVIENAICDVGSANVRTAIDVVSTVRFIADTDAGMSALFPRNPARHVAARLGLAADTFYQGTIGGNTPQYLVNHLASSLASGKHSMVVLAGAELLATLFSALGTGADISKWAGDKEDEPETIGTDREWLSDIERLHGLYEPINTYPLFESSLRHHMGRSHEDHQAYIAEICSKMSQVAANNSHAWNQQTLSAETIASPEGKNRYIGYPYTKAMNPVLAVDMAAAIVMTTAGKARELGIEEDKWVYVRGGVDINDIWNVTERPCLHESPAIRKAWEVLSENCDVTLDAITDFDIYSCFPSAVEISCNEIGLSPLDPRGVTVTGGLPYLGGPGNNYSLHAIAQMVANLRERELGNGLVTANGLYLTKHSLGLYSTEPGEQAWVDTDTVSLQKAIDSGPRLSLASNPVGSVVVEACTVAFDRSGPKLGFAIARNPSGERIVANIEDPSSLERVLKQDTVGSSATVEVVDGRNILAF